ncbi:MAG TPA: hypothetical protein VLV28_09995 [Gaiellaceae bacterium]|nr:hypothetical protein [Gaiellaceae bacterium]
MRLGRPSAWVLTTVLVVLATRTIVYALAPQSVLLAALAHDEVGPDVTVPLVVGTLSAAVASAAVLWLAATAVRERLLIEGRRLVAVPRLRPLRLAGRAVALFLVASFAFAMLESYIHWREGLGWHGLRCLVGPVHRDAIPVLAGLSLLAVGVHGAIEHLLAWARRLFAQLTARLASVQGHRPSPLRPGLLRPRLVVSGNGARGPPLVHRPCPGMSL